MSLIKKVYKSFIHGPIYVVAFGLIFFGIGGGLTLREYIFRQDALEAQGEVMGHTMGGCDGDGCSYRSVVRFDTQEGETVSYTSTYSSSPPSHDKGEIVTVFYSPGNPEKAMIKGEGIVFRIIFMIVGGAIMLVGMGVFVSILKDSLIAEE